MEIKKCPLKRDDCKCDDFSIVSNVIREGDGTILNCPRCDLLMQDLHWSYDEIIDFYDNEYQTINSLVDDTYLDAQQHYDHRIKTIEREIDKIKPLLKKSMNVLEIGCGTGEILAKIKPFVSSCTGIELHKEYSKFVNEKLRIRCYSDDLLKINFNDEKFDLIIADNVLDHMQNPLDELIRMRELINNNGSLLLILPNLNEALQKFLPEKHLENYRRFTWKKAHFFYFTPETITTMLSAAGFDCEIDYYHQYTFKNYLKWFFVGERQYSYDTACNEYELLSSDDPFAQDLNLMMKKMNEKFHILLRKYGRSDNMVITAKTKN